MTATPSDADILQPIIVVPYNPMWPKEFLLIYEHLWPVIQLYAERIEHVGSTAVPGLAAKPIIDLDVVIADVGSFQAVKDALQSLGYRHNGDQGIPGREAFKYDPSQKPDLMSHHLYVCAADSVELNRHLTLRDHLRTHPADRDSYAAVKYKAAQSHPDDIDGYIEAKSPFIRTILDHYQLNDPLSVLANTYALHPSNLTKVDGGWSADAYRVDATEGTFFLKVYDKTRPSIASYIQGMSAYLPALRQLNLNPCLSSHLPEVVPTHNGAFFTEDKDHVYLLHKFIDGQTIGSGDLTENEVDQLADMLAELHTYSEDWEPGILLPRNNFYFDLSAQLHFLRADRRREQPDDLREIIADNKALLDQVLNRLSNLADKLRSANYSFCLVHGDLHNWNLMRSGNKLILLDVEDLRFSLPELDLMFLVDKPYYARFLARYQLHYPGYQTNDEAITCFWLRRDMTDVVQFTKQIAYENLNESSRAQAIHWLTENFRNLRKWL